MSFNRILAPVAFRSGRDLDNDLNAIGMNVACDKPSIDPNIEDALVAATIEGIQKNDGRLIGLLIDWISIHGERINVARLTELVLSLDERKHYLIQVFWAANAQRLSKDVRFKTLAGFKPKERIDFIDRHVEPESYRSTPFLIEKNGEDERFHGTCIRIPNKVYSHRPHQIASPAELAKRHNGYRYRIMFGPSFRADIWAILRRTPHLSPSELARRVYCSYATAFETKKDYLLVKRDYSKRTA